MFCSNCGTKLDEGAKFCANCGTPVDGGAPNGANGSQGEFDKFADQVNTKAEETFDKAKVVASEVADQASEAFDKAAEVGGEAFDKAKEVGGEAFEKAKEVGGEAFDKAREVGGEAFEQAKVAAAQTYEKTKVQLKEFNYELNKNPNSTKVKVIIAAIIAVVLCIGGAIFWYTRPIMQAERFVAERTGVMVYFLTSSQNVNAEAVENELAHWGDGPNSALNYVRSTGGLERNVKNIPYVAEQFALTILSRDVGRDVNKSDFKIIKKVEYEEGGRDYYVFLMENNNKKSSTKGYLISVAKNKKGDFYVDAWIALDNTEMSKAERSMETGNFDRYK